MEIDIVNQHAYGVEGNLLSGQYHMLLGFKVVSYKGDAKSQIAKEYLTGAHRGDNQRFSNATKMGRYIAKTVGKRTNSFGMTRCSLWFNK